MVDIVEIHKFTQDKKVIKSKNAVYNQKKINKVDALRLVVYACRKMYGVNNTAKIIYGIGVDKIDLSV